jgi:hypothetical protein
LFFFSVVARDQLGNLLMLESGLCSIPPGGLDQKIQIHFSTEPLGASFADHANGKGFFASTCCMELHIPSFVRYEEMLKAFNAVLPLATHFTDI